MTLMHDDFHAGKLSEVLTTREAADLLGVSLKSVQHWCEDGLLESWKTAGGHRRVVRASVERLIASRRNKPHPLPLAAQTAPIREGGLTVYVVEDDPVYQRLYRLRLGTWQPAPQLLTFSNGYELLVRIGRQVPDLLISDVRMPGMNGIEMLRALQRIPECAGLEVIVVTGLSASELAELGGLPPGVRVMNKPPSFEEIEAIAAEIRRLAA